VPGTVANLQPAAGREQRRRDRHDEGPPSPPLLLPHATRPPARFRSITSRGSMSDPTERFPESNKFQGSGSGGDEGVRVWQRGRGVVVAARANPDVALERGDLRP